MTRWTPGHERYPEAAGFIIPARDHPGQRQPDIRLAKKHLGWQPKVALEDGLKETIGYFRKMMA